MSEDKIAPVIGKQNEECLEELLRRDRLVTYTSLYVHLLDQLMWGMLSKQEVCEAAADLRSMMGMPDAEKTGAKDAPGLPAAGSATAAAKQKFRLADVPELPAGCAAERSCVLALIQEYGAGLMSLITRETLLCADGGSAGAEKE